jgi:hypothetical protein
MQFLKSIESKYDSLSILIKVELFLVPLIFLFYFTFFEANNQSQKKIINPIDIQNIDININSVEILKNIEDYLASKKIQIIELSNKKNQIKIVVKIKKLNEYIEFLKFIEEYNPYSKIVSIEDILGIKTLTISFDRFYIKEKLDLSKYFKKIINKSSYKLTAIVGDKAYINQKWLSIGEHIDNYEIVNIGVDTVVLKNKNNSFTMEIFDERTF